MLPQHTAPTLEGSIRWHPSRSLWLLCMLAPTIWWGPTYITLPNIFTFIALSVLTLCLGHSVGLHRGLIHQTYQTTKTWERFLVYLATLSGMGGPLGLYRLHETRDYWQNQPHAPAYYTYDHSLLRDHWWYCHAQFHPHTKHAQAPITLPPRLQDDLFYLWLDRTWMAQQLPIALLMWAVGGPGLVIWGVCARVSVSILGHWFVNYMAHTSGTQRYHIHGSLEQGRNNRLLGALSFGEGWHNNHHAWPNSARLGHAPGEWDPGYQCIRIMARHGLVWDVQTFQDQRPRRAMTRLT